MNLVLVKIWILRTLLERTQNEVKNHCGENLYYIREYINHCEQIVSRSMGVNLFNMLV